MSGAFEIGYLVWKSEQHSLTPKNDIMRALVPLVKHCNMALEEDDKKFKIICKLCNGFVTCLGHIGELLYITFLHAGMSTIGIYPEELVSEIF